MTYFLAHSLIISPSLPLTGAPSVLRHTWTSEVCDCVAEDIHYSTSVSAGTWMLDMRAIHIIAPSSLTVVLVWLHTRYVDRYTAGVQGSGFSQKIFKAFWQMKVMHTYSCTQTKKIQQYKDMTAASFTHTHTHIHTHTLSDIQVIYYSV